MDCRSASRRHTIAGHGFRYVGLRVALVAAASVSAQAPSASGVATSRSAPSIEGTKWQFPYSTITKKTTTLEFLGGGRFRSDGTVARGFWKQNGKEVVINMNDFTLFRLNIDGDTMRGTWERLHGDDAGRKSPSILTRAPD